MNDFYLNGIQQSAPLPSWFTHLGVGVFETMRARYVAEEKIVSILGFDAHLDRLFQGYQIVCSSVASREEIVACTLKACINFDWSKCPDARLRVVALEKDWIVTIEPWKASLDVEQGIKAISFEVERSVPEIKSCSAIASALARKKLSSRGCDEAFLIDREGILREGSWSNFFWVNSEGALITTQNRVLFGVTRSIVLELGKKHGEVQEKDFPLTTILNEAVECFMTQTSHGIVPVISINGDPVGSGKVGERTKVLISSYRSFMEQGDEPFTKNFTI